jgi:hypothetical protein
MTVQVYRPDGIRKTGNDRKGNAVAQAAAHLDLTGYWIQEGSEGCSYSRNKATGAEKDANGASSPADSAGKQYFSATLFHDAKAPFTDNFDCFARCRRDSAGLGTAPV